MKSLTCQRHMRVYAGYMLTWEIDETWTTLTINTYMNQTISLWEQLESKKITREELQPTLFKKLGQPANELQQNLAQELIKKIVSYYYQPKPDQNYTIYSVVGWVAEIVQRKWKEGPKKGQVYYDLILGTKEKLKAEPAHLTKEQFSQIQKLALLGQNLVFQYRKWFANKQILGWYLATKTSKN